MALSETFGRSEKPSILKKVPGFELWTVERSGSAKKGGGLAIFYRDTLMAHEWNPIVSEQYKYIEKERQWLLIRGEGSNKMAFLNCYPACQSFSSDEFIDWNASLFQLMTQEAIYLRKEGFMILAMGDFNTRVGRLQGLDGNVESQI